VHFILEQNGIRSGPVQLLVSDPATATLQDVLELLHSTNTPHHMWNIPRVRFGSVVNLQGRLDPSAPSWGLPLILPLNMLVNEDDCLVMVPSETATTSTTTSTTQATNRNATTTTRIETPRNRMVSPAVASRSIATDPKSRSPSGTSNNRQRTTKVSSTVRSTKAAAEEQKKSKNKKRTSLATNSNSSTTTTTATPRNRSVSATGASRSNTANINSSADSRSRTTSVSSPENETKAKKNKGKPLRSSSLSPAKRAEDRRSYEPRSQHYLRCTKDNIEYPVTVERNVQGNTDKFLVRYLSPYSRTTRKVSKSDLLPPTPQRQHAYSAAIMAKEEDSRQRKRKRQQDAAHAKQARLESEEKRKQEAPRQARVLEKIKLSKAARAAEKFGPPLPRDALPSQPAVEMAADGRSCIVTEPLYHRRVYFTSNYGDSSSWPAETLGEIASKLSIPVARVIHDNQSLIPNGSDDAARWTAKTILPAGTILVAPIPISNNNASGGSSRVLDLEEVQVTRVVGPHCHNTPTLESLHRAIKMESSSSSSSSDSMTDEESHQQPDHHTSLGTPTAQLDEERLDVFI
jgi:hypothetical protein